MINTRLYFVFAILLISSLTFGVFFPYNFNEKEVVDPVGGVERPYYFRILLSQGSIKILDLNGIEDSILQGNSRSKAFAQSTYSGYLGKLEKGSQVFLQIYSLDVPHGFSINDLDIHITILETTENVDKTLPYSYDFILPETDSSFTAYCQINCGFGHSNMKIRFAIGDGEPQNGILFFNIFLILIAAIAILFVYLISAFPRKNNI